MIRTVILCLALLTLSCAAQPATHAPRARPLDLSAELEQSSHQQIVVAGTDDRFASAYVLTDFGVWAVARRDGKVYRVD